MGTVISDWNPRSASQYILENQYARIFKGGSKRLDFPSVIHKRVGLRSTYTPTVLLVYAILSQKTGVCVTVVEILYHPVPGCVVLLEFAGGIGPTENTSQE